MKRNNIEVIGAGSATFSLDIIRDLIITPGLHNSNIILVDKDEERLNAIARVAQSYNDEMNAGYTFQTETSWEKPLRGAVDYVILAALAGGRDAMDQDRALLEEHGYYRGIGINTPFRQLKLMMDVGETMADRCPDATLIMAANPVPEGCGLIHQATGVDTIGICHGHHELKKLYGLLGISDFGLVSSQVAGINHNIWLKNFTYKGENAYPMLDDWINTAAESFYKFYTPVSHHADYQISKVALDMYKRYGLFPVGDTVRGVMPEFWWYADSPQTKEKWFGPTQGFDGDIGHNMNLSWLTNIVKNVNNFSPSQSATRTFGLHRSEWDIIPYIDARENNTGAELQLSIPNKGAIKGLDDETFVEVPVKVDSNGLSRLEEIEFSNLLLQGVLIPRELLARRIISAMLERDERYIIQTWLADWKTKHPGQAESAWEALISADWNQDMFEYYRSK